MIDNKPQVANEIITGILKSIVKTLNESDVAEIDLSPNLCKPVIEYLDKIRHQAVEAENLTLSAKLALVKAGELSDKLSFYALNVDCDEQATSRESYAEISRLIIDFLILSMPENADGSSVLNTSFLKP